MKKEEIIANNSKNSKLTFEKFFIIVLYIQPLLDVTTGILLHFGYSITISSIVRLIFMAFCIFYLFFIIKNKTINIYLIFLISYFILYTLTILISKNVSVLNSEIKNLLSTFYFVIVLLTLIKTYENKKFNVKTLNILYVVYLFLVFVPNLLNLGFNSYSHSKIGSIGWFSSANTVGSVLSILLPFIFVSLKKINIKIIILLIISSYTVFSIGTKVPVLSFIIVIFINMVYFIIFLLKNNKHRKLIISLLLILIVLITASSTIIIKKTTFYKNLVIHINYLEKEGHGHIKAYRFLDHFIFSERLTFQKRTRKIYNDSNTLEKLFGIGYMKKNISNKPFYKTIEIDYFDVFYRHGLIGFLLFFLPVLYVIVELIKKCKNVYTDQKKLNIFISILLIFSLALFQGHIFVTPQISIYAALILSLSYNNSFNYN